MIRWASGAAASLAGVGRGEQAGPGRFVEHINGERSGCVHGAEDGEKFQWRGTGVEGGVRFIHRDVCHVTRTKGAFFPADPLFGLAFQQIDYFFAAGMPVKTVQGTWRESGADQNQFLRPDEFRV